jgi:hypothetical protein
VSKRPNHEAGPTRTYYLSLFHDRCAHTQWDSTRAWARGDVFFWIWRHVRDRSTTQYNFSEMAMAWFQSVEKSFEREDEQQQKLKTQL